MVFIAPFDIFGRGLYRYTFEGVCRECPDLKLNDGALRIFINTKGENRGDFSQEFLDFCDYVTDSTDEVAERSGSDRIKLIHKYVSGIRKSEKMGAKYMQRWEELKNAQNEGMQTGMQLGLERGLKLYAYKMVARGRLTVQEALEDLETGISEEEFFAGMQEAGFCLP